MLKFGTENGEPKELSFKKFIRNQLIKKMLQITYDNLPGTTEIEISFFPAKFPAFLKKSLIEKSFILFSLTSKDLTLLIGEGSMHFASVVGAFVVVVLVVVLVVDVVLVVVDAVLAVVDVVVVVVEVIGLSVVVEVVVLTFFSHESESREEISHSFSKTPGSKYNSPSSINSNCSMAEQSARFSGIA